MQTGKTGTRFWRRKRTLFGKALELARLSGANVYLVVQYKGKYHVLNSMGQVTWPPRPEDIEHSYPLPEVYNCIEAAQAGVHMSSLELQNGTSSTVFGGESSVGAPFSNYIQLAQSQA